MQSTKAASSTSSFLHIYLAVLSETVRPDHALPPFPTPRPHPCQSYGQRKICVGYRRVPKKRVSAAGMEPLRQTWPAMHPEKQAQEYRFASMWCGWSEETSTKAQVRNTPLVHSDFPRLTAFAPGHPAFAASYLCIRRCCPSQSRRRYPLNFGHRTSARLRPSFGLSS